MKKRFFNALLLGAVLLSTNVVTSCKDYDDDINNLQGQIDKLATAEQLKSEISTLNSAVTAAKAEAIAEANKALEAAKKAQETADKAATKEQLDELKKSVEKAEAAAQKAQDDLEAAKANLEELIAKKADKADLDAANTKIAEAMVAISENKAAAAAAQAAADAAKVAAGDAAAAAAKALADAKAAVADAKSALETEIAKKADKTALTAAENRIKALEDFVGNLEENISLGKVIDDRIATTILDASNKESLAGKVAALESLINSMEDGSIAVNIKNLQDDVEALKAEAEALIGAYSAMVTNVSLVASLSKQYSLTASEGSWYFGDIYLYETENGNNGRFIAWVDNAKEYSLTFNIDGDLDFVVSSEKDNVFPENKDVVDKQLEFKKGQHSVMGDMLLVRVNPTNAILKKEDINLINSQGKELTDIVECTNVEPYKGLITRGAGDGSGLWVVTYNLKKDFKAEDLSNAISDKGSQILYAVSVNTSKADTENGEKQLVSEGRRVVSEYDVALSQKAGNNAYDFTVNNVGVNRIHNRYYRSENGVNTEGIVELNWIGDAAVKPIIWGDNANASNRYQERDNRQYNNSLAVVMGEDIKIEYPADKPIKGFYVTLDYDFAVGSGGTDVSEINAWNSYDYENVGLYTFKGFEKTGVKTPAKMFEGNVGVIKVNSLNNVRGDIIGFRVNAVNLDGTLVDPDGRAFYVAVGDDVKNDTLTTKIEDKFVEIYPTMVNGIPSKEGRSGKLDLDKIGFNFIKNVSYWGQYLKDSYVFRTWTVEETNPKIDGAVADAVKVIFYDGKGNEITGYNLVDAINNGAVKQFEIVVNDLSEYLDGETYKQSMQTFEYVNNGYIPVQKVILKWKKVLPSTFPQNFAFRPMQEIKEGGFIAYMYPNLADKTDFIASEPARNGHKDLNDIFYGLDKNYHFSLETSAKKNGKDVAVPVVFGSGDAIAYPFEIDKSYIDTKTQHDVNVSYFYGNISTKYDDKGKLHRGQPWFIGCPDNPLKVTYACWAAKNSYAWVKDTDITKGLQWKADGDIVTLVKTSQIMINNGYNNAFFGKNLWELAGKNPKTMFLSIDRESLRLEYNGQINPYFKPEFTGDFDCINFTQNKVQADANPTADHTENLIFNVKDCFGHVNEVKLEVKILNAK